MGVNQERCKICRRFRENHEGAAETRSKALQGIAQVEKYDQIDRSGHLYGAIIASVREYIEVKKKGRYAEYNLAYAAHYIGDLSQPLHHTLYEDFNRRYHSKMDGIVNDEVLDNLDKIKVYPIEIKTEQDLAKEIARIANLSMVQCYKLEDESRLLTREETYNQLSHSSSLMKAVLDYLEK